METTSKPKPLWPIFIGGIVLILLFVIVAKLLTALSPEAAPEDAARIAERTKAHEDLLAENKQKLETYAWVDKAKGSVQIPISQAMTMTMAELNQRPPAPAGPVNPPAAPETPAPAAPATEAPAPAPTAETPAAPTQPAPAP